MHLSIVLTGGPGGGKSTLIRELCADESRGKRLTLIPEAARQLARQELIRRGLQA